ncbi:MAG: hypothetical protein GX971_00205 [Firmicutes bacterium]|nr:hypothetical protein [Bacillota bacterium]
MNFRKFKVQIALLAFLVVVVIGLGASYLYKQTQIIKPLTEQLQNVNGVSDVNVEQNFLGQGARILVQLEIEREFSVGPVIGAVQEILATTSGNYALLLRDSADPSLVRLFERMQIAAEEAIVTGEFTSLEQRVQNLAENEGVTWQLAMDRDFIYLSLATGDSYLHRVISRGNNEGKVVIYTIGGGNEWLNG